MAPLLDQEQIAELQAILEDDFADLVDTFLNDLTLQLEILHRALDATDGQTVYAKAHRLKSGSGSIGARRLSELFQQMEDCSRDNRLDSCNALLQQVDQSASQTRAILQAIVHPGH